MPDVPYRPASVIFVDPIWLDVKRPLRLGSYEACACRWRYAAERVLVPHARSEHHRRVVGARLGRDGGTQRANGALLLRGRRKPRGAVEALSGSAAARGRSARLGAIVARSVAAHGGGTAFFPGAGVA